MSARGRAAERDDDGKRNGGSRRYLGGRTNSEFGRILPMTTTAKMASSTLMPKLAASSSSLPRHYAGASSTEDESGWESEFSVETDVESELESEVEGDDDGFDADSEGEFAASSPVGSPGALRTTSLPGFHHNVGFVPFNNIPSMHAIGNAHMTGHQSNQLVGHASNLPAGYQPSLPAGTPGLSKYYFVPSTGEFVALEGGSCWDLEKVGEGCDSKNTTEESDTEVQDDHSEDEDHLGDKDHVREGNFVQGDGQIADHDQEDDDILKKAWVEEDETCSHPVKDAKEFSLPNAEKHQENVEFPDENCHIENAERNLNLLISVITETQQHLDEIFSKHNIDYSALTDVEDAGESEVGKVDDDIVVGSGIHSEKEVKVEEEMEVIKIPTPTSSGSTPTLEEEPILSTSDKRGNTPAEDFQNGLFEMTCKTGIMGDTSHLVAVEENTEEGERSLATNEEVAVKDEEVAEDEDKDPSSPSPSLNVDAFEDGESEIVWVRMENGWILQDKGSMHDLLSAVENEETVTDSGETRNNANGDEKTTNLHRFLAPSLSLAVSLGMLCTLSKFSVMFVVSSVSFFLAFFMVILVTFAHLYQLLWSKPFRNPFQVILDLDLDAVFTAFLVPALSRVFVSVGCCLETLRRAYLFHSLLNSLKLILVTYLLFLFGDSFTISRLVLTFNLAFFLSQLGLSRFLRSSTFFSSVIKWFF